MRSKNKKLLIVFIIMLIIAVAGGLALYSWLTPKKTTVYVFKNNAQTGTVVTESMLIPVQCDSSIFVAGSQASTATQFVTGNELKNILNAGDTLKMDVAQGMPLTAAMLSVSGGSSVEMMMDPSKIAVSVPCNSVNGVTSDLRAGARVNVYAAGLNDSSTTLLFQNMKVIDVKKNDNTLSALTLEVTADESLKLIYAQTYSSLYFGLVSGSGYQTIEGEPTFSAEVPEKETEKQQQ